MHSSSLTVLLLWLRGCNPNRCCHFLGHTLQCGGPPQPTERIPRQQRIQQIQIKNCPCFIRHIAPHIFCTASCIMQAVWNARTGLACVDTRALEPWPGRWCVTAAAPCAWGSSSKPEAGLAIVDREEVAVAVCCCVGCGGIVKSCDVGAPRKYLFHRKDVTPHWLHSRVRLTAQHHICHAATATVALLGPEVSASCPVVCCSPVASWFFLSGSCRNTTCPAELHSSSSSCGRGVDTASSLASSLFYMLIWGSSILHREIQPSGPCIIVLACVLPAVEFRPGDEFTRMRVLQSCRCK